MADFRESNGSESQFGANGHKTRVSVSGPTGTGVMDALALDARRRAALAEIDEARFSWFHAKVCLVAGIGFFTDAIASIMLGYVYGKDQALTKHQDLGVKVATPVGTLVGQVVFGWLADIVGRKKMYGVELLIMVVSTFAQALVGNAAAVDIIAVVIVWRFIMGVGIGGDYPLSAIISSEFAPKKTRGRMMTAVFASQGWGNFTASLVAFIITAAYRDSILAEPVLDQLNSVDFMWRLLIGLGCVPGVVGLYFRLTIPETPRFTMDIERNLEAACGDIQGVVGGGGRRGGKADGDGEDRENREEQVGIVRIQAPKASWGDFRAYFGRRENAKILFSTAYSWFALDIAFYGLGLNSANILHAIGFGEPTKEGVRAVYDNLNNVCIGNLILSAAGLIPGYWVAFFFIDSWGRKQMQLMGFVVLTGLFVILGFGYDKLKDTKAFVFLYCLANFFQNFGPNVTTFVIPGEIFPTRYRSTAHGISAASGKLGAIVAQVGFSQLKDIGGRDQFVGHILKIFAFFMLTGVFSTLLLPETKKRSLEELSNEKQEGFVKGPAVQRDNIELKIIPIASSC
ncbi:unnamed protein product [Cyclocybe aegerita]|uniref:Major facilitator superfamily (MFS) profile domain-containing protein n=1 Tax=Cyclocybe aegerita TaxID=1973307 RepID=A0A8S0W9H9_CYCAE|nr:unnamed protein product [Cyclocybe aegerita]